MTNEYEVRGEVTAIFLKRRDGTVLETLIDTADLPLAGSVPGAWVVKERSSRVTRYATAALPRRGGKQVSVTLHRLLAGKPAGKVVDHINHDGLDNRRRNIRVTSNAANCFNRRGANRNSKTGVRGVSWDKGVGKFVAQVPVPGEPRAGAARQRIGFYSTLAEAEAAVVAARREIEQTIYPSSAAA